MTRPAKPAPRRRTRTLLVRGIPEDIWQGLVRLAQGTSAETRRSRTAVVIEAIRREVERGKVVPGPAHGGGRTP